MSDSESSSPPRKVKRHNCKCEGLKQQINKLNDDLKKRDKLLQDQLKFLAEALAKQRVILNALYTKQSDVESIRKKFPILNEHQLSDINENIAPDNEKEYIEAIKTLILPNGIKKNLKNILSPQITYDFNIDGVQGKKSLKALSNFYKVILDSIQCDGKANSEEELRKAIQLQKKRYFKSVAAKKNTIQEEM